MAVLVSIAQSYLSLDRRETSERCSKLEPNETDDGNGMRLIGWSRKGTKLLAELARWTYGTDTGMDRDVIVYDSTSGKISKFDVAESLSRHFGSDCAFEFETKAWHEPGAVVVAVRVYKSRLFRRNCEIVRAATHEFNRGTVYRSRQAGLEPVKLFRKPRDLRILYSWRS